MSYQKSKEKINDLILTGYPYVHVVTDDDVSTTLGIRSIIENDINVYQDSKYELITWSLAEGFNKEIQVYSTLIPENRNNKDDGKDKKEQPKTVDEKFKELFMTIKQYGNAAIFVVQDIDSCYKSEELTVELKSVINSISKSIIKGATKLKRYMNNTKEVKLIYALSDRIEIPTKLNKLVTVVEYALPGKEDLHKIVKTFVTQRQLNLTEKELLKIADAGVGLTEFEFSSAVFNSYVQKSGESIDTMQVSAIKEQIIKKGGILQFFNTKINLSDIGGLENLMDWVRKRELAFDERLREERKLKFPKGILLTGIPGCGKSESVKAIATYLKLPLIRLDTGSLMGKYVGDTESNTRKAIGLAESLAPAVLWIDEIEKSFPDPRSSGTHEVSNRLMSFFLTWLQEKTSEVFVVATANNIDKLPPELLRKGRFAEIFFVDLPKRREREIIFDIHLKRIGAIFNKLDLEVAAENSEGYSGAEIEEIVQESNFQSAFEDKPLSIEYLLEEIRRTTPLSVIMGEKLEDIKEWATKNKVRMASAE